MEGLSTAFQTLLPRQGWGTLSTGSALMMAGSTVLALDSSFTIKELKAKGGFKITYTKLQPSFFLIPMLLGGLVSTFSNVSFPLTDSQVANFSALFVPSLTSTALLGAGLGTIAFFRNQTVEDGGGSVNVPLMAAAVLGGLAVAMILGTVKLPESSWWNSTGVSGYGTIGLFLLGLGLPQALWGRGDHFKKLLGLAGVFFFLSATLGARWTNLAFNNLNQSLKVAGLHPSV